MAHAPTLIGLGPRFPAAFVVATAMAIDAVVCGCGGLLALRRLTADWQPPASPALLAAVCVAGGLLVTAGDLARRLAGGRPGWLSRLGLTLAVLAVAAPLPAASAGQAAMGVAAVVAVGLVAARPWLPRRSTVPMRPAVPVAPRSGEQPPEVCHMPRPSAPPPAPVPGQILQHFTRFTRSDGVECVHGRLYLAVPAGVRSAAGHIGFCPPFPLTPAVEVTTDYDAVEAMVTAAEVVPWGARIECRLDEPADDAFEIPIDIIAEATAAGPNP